MSRARSHLQKYLAFEGACFLKFKRYFQYSPKIRLYNLRNIWYATVVIVPMVSLVLCSVQAQNIEIGVTNNEYI